MELLRRIAEFNEKLANDVFGERFHLVYVPYNKEWFKIICVDAKYADYYIDHETFQAYYINHNVGEDSLYDSHLDKIMSRMAVMMNSVIVSSDFWELYRKQRKGDNK